MSTFKKLLALTLALAMVLSVSAFAGYKADTYKDAAGIDEDCEDAIELMYALKIMKGDTNGNFNPTATITRAEIAKMIYVILNYGKDDKAVNYTGAKLFSDVAAGAWYEGYVNYCGTTKLVQGRGNGTFGPNDPVTTAEAAKMLLTAIGYSAEARGYVGAGWDKQVLSDASIIGLLDGYNYSTTTHAPRQWVAVMFKNALTDAYTYGTIAPVIFNGLLNGTTLPSADYKTMGEKYFGLYKWSGVITANEYADLYGKSGLSSDNTKIDKGEYVFKNWSTDLTEIGEYRWGYAVEDGTKDLVVYVGGEDENTTFSTGAATVLSDSKFKTNTGLKKGGEYFVNFAEASLRDTGNGEWLKVIDNDGDGKADYVFITTFTMAAFDEVDDDDNAWLTNGTKFSDGAYELYEDADYADVVIYTTIDGVTYIELAPSFKGEAEKYTYKNDALTVDGEDYVESDIAYDNKLDYYAEVELAKKDTEYVFYKDFFGNIRLFGREVSDNGDLVLLTDAYYETNRSGSIAAVDAYLDGEIVDTDVYNSAYYTDVEMFINTRESDNNAWGRLVAFGGDREAQTMLARYEMEDGVMSLYTAKTYRYKTNGDVKDVKTQYIDLINTQNVKAGQTSYIGLETEIDETSGVATYPQIEGQTAEVKVQANRDTVFYYVSWATGSPVIKTVTGYKNSYDVNADIVGVKAMYAVATDVSDDAASKDYWVADAIVIETNLPVFNLLTNDIVFGYDVVNRAVSDYASLDVVKADAALDTLEVISHNGDDFDTFDAKGTLNVLNFFFNTVDENGDSYLVDLTDYRTNEIYVGTVDRANVLYEYVTLKNGTIDELVYTENTVVYNVSENTNYNSIETVSAGLVTGKDYIFFAPDKEVVYAILVDDILTMKLFDEIAGDGSYTAGQAAAIADLKSYAAAAAKVNGCTVADIQAVLDAQIELVKAATTQAEIDAIIDADLNDDTHTGAETGVKALWDAAVAAGKAADDANAAKIAEIKAAVDGKIVTVEYDGETAIAALVDEKLEALAADGEYTVTLQPYNIPVGSGIAQATADVVIEYAGLTETASVTVYIAY